MSFKGFNPFKKNIEGIEGEDLSKLKEVSEGWYLDYKRELIKQKDIAKQLSGFANQYGGWLIFGVEEDSERTAGEFIGIPNGEVEAALVTIRNAASQNVKPYVNYSTNIVKGPVQNVGLEDGRSIIIVFIPEGIDTPYIHSSGKIYLRISDCSEPKEVNDRSLLDQLYKRRETMLLKRREFLETVRIGNSPSLPTLNVYLLTNPDFISENTSISLNNFGNTFNKKSKIRIPMETIHTVPNGFIAKHSQGNRRLMDVIALRWWHNGNALLSIPINKFELSKNLSPDYEHYNSFRSLCARKGLGYEEAIDLSKLFYSLLGLLSSYMDIIDQTTKNSTISLSILLSNVGNTIPFINDELFIDDISNRGIPVIEEHNIRMPTLDEDCSLLSLLEPNTLPKGDINREIFLAGAVVTQILNATGIGPDGKSLLSRYKSILNTDAAKINADRTIESLQ